jgi:hypothetical protein
MVGEFEKLAYEAALRRLDKQEGQLAEVYRRLAYDLDCFWHSNNATIGKLTRAYKTAAAALVVEVVSLVALLGDTIL